MKRLPFTSMTEIADRVTDLVEFGGGEGYALLTARFDGKPAVIVDQGTLVSLLDDDDPSDAVLVHVFETEAEREAFVATHRTA